jgi:hypothetical protein
LAASLANEGEKLVTTVHPTTLGKDETNLVIAKVEGHKFLTSSLAEDGSK